MFRTKHGSIIILSKITHISHVQYDEQGEWRRVYFSGDAMTTIRGDDCMAIEKALEDSFGGAIWKWE